MLDELIEIHNQVLSTTPRAVSRYLAKQINWDAQAICILGSRGVGKTTLMCQKLMEFYHEPNTALYISADNIHVLSHGLFTIAQEYFKFGGKALFIDEVHKYPNWSLEIKNIIDTYKDRKIIFSGSSSLDLVTSKYDLSRRVVYYTLRGLSFREYLHFSENITMRSLTFQEILQQHEKLAQQFGGMSILKHFKDYLIAGYFPFFLEGRKDYIAKVNNIIEKVIYEDIAVVYELRLSTLNVLKKLLWLVATSDIFVPNIDRISKNLGASREIVYSCFEYLDRSGLLNNIYPKAAGMKLVRKPGKIYLENTNLLYAINGTLRLETNAGGNRETFFVNQILDHYRINLHDHGDFVVEGKYVIEVGGKHKNFRQIKEEENAYLAIDGIEIGFGKKIPLYLFGFLY